MKQFKFLLLLSFFMALFSIYGCSEKFSCDDGEQNQGELGIDCGGPCEACNVAAPTCTDGLQNGGESGVDCGGSCPPCSTTPTCSDGVMNGTETGVDCGGSCTPCSTTNGTFTALIDGTAFTATTINAIDTGTKLNLVASDGTTTITLVHEGAYATGTYNFSQTAPAIYAEAAIGCNNTSGTLTFTTFNTTTKKVAGSFVFDCTDAQGGTGDHSITQGQFSNVTYN